MNTQNLWSFIDEYSLFISFNINNRCLKLSDVKQHFPALIMTDTPRGHSINEVTSYSAPADKNGNTISFSFSVGNPDCVRNVVISRD